MVDQSLKFMTYTLRHAQKNTTCNSTMKINRKPNRIIDDPDMVQYIVFVRDHAATGFPKEDRVFQRPIKNLTSLEGVLFQHKVVGKGDINQAVSKHVKKMRELYPQLLPAEIYTNTSVRKTHSDILDSDETLPASVTKSSLGHTEKSETYKVTNKSKEGQKRIARAITKNIN